jgi:hypothetical protein
MNGSRYCTASPTLDEDALHKMVADAINGNAPAKAIKDFFFPVNQYDDRLTRLLVERVKVKRDGKLEVAFKT